MIFGSVYTNGLGAIFQQEIFVMFGARVTTGTIMTSQVNVVATRLVEWTLSISENKVFFCCFQELSGFKILMVTQIKCGIKAKRHGRSVLRN